jgi:WD40 repeat protein
MKWVGKSISLGHKPPVFCNRTLLGAEATSLYTWNTQNWKRDRKPSAHTEPIYVITLSGDGDLVASGDMGGTIIIWGIKSLF